MITGRVAPAVVHGDGEAVYEDCTFRAEEWWQVILLTGGQLTLRRCRIEGGLNRGIDVRGGRLILEDCLLVGNRLGLVASGAAHVTMRRCTIEGPGSLGLLFQRGTAGALSDCAVSGFEDMGLLVRQGAAPILEDCTLSATVVGARFQTGARPVLRRCTLHDARVGGWIEPTAAPVLRACRIERATSTGMFLQGGGELTECRLVGNNIGICLQEGATTAIVGCDVEGGDSMGIYAMVGARSHLRGCRIGPHPQGTVVAVDGASVVVHPP